MKAVRMHRYGGPEVLVLDDVAPPPVGPRDVLVEVHAASVNPVDWKIRRGVQRALVRYRLPVTLGLDFSGVVAEIGRDVRRFRVGDEVYGSPTHTRSGCYAELVAVDEDQLARKPKNLSHVEAASVPLVGLTVWQTLVERARLTAGQRVLIHAGAGGVGTFAIQLAKHLGAIVSTTSSGKNVALVRELGADEAIDYETTRFEEVLAPQDVVLDTLGGSVKRRSLAVLKKGGVLVSVQAGFPEHVERHGPYLGVVVTFAKLVAFHASSRLFHGVRSHLVVRRPSGEQLAKIAHLFEAGVLRPRIDRVFSLADIAEAHRFSETARARGKIAIAVKPA